MHNLSLILYLCLSQLRTFSEIGKVPCDDARANRCLSPTSFGWLSHLSFAHCLSVPTSVPLPLLYNGPQRKATQKKKISEKLNYFAAACSSPVRSLFIFNGQTGSNIQLSAIFIKIEWCCTIDATMRHNVASAIWSQLHGENENERKRKQTKNKNRETRVCRQF